VDAENKIGLVVKDEILGLQNAQEIKVALTRERRSAR